MTCRYAYQKEVCEFCEFIYFSPFKFNYKIIVAVFWGESEEGNVTLLNKLKKYISWPFV